jgi:hypothetical protein
MSIRVHDSGMSGFADALGTGFGEAVASAVAVTLLLVLVVSVSMGATVLLALAIGARYRVKATLAAIVGGFATATVGTLVDVPALVVPGVVGGLAWGLSRYEPGGLAVLQGRLAAIALRLLGVGGILVTIGGVAVFGPMFLDAVGEVPVSSLVVMGLVLAPGALGVWTLRLD